MRSQSESVVGRRQHYAAIGPYGSPFSPVRGVLLVVLLLGLASCEKEGAVVPPSQYQSALIGQWQGAAGGRQESIRFDADGTFSCDELPTGFISTTLDQGTADTVVGTWALTGSVISLAIDRASSQQPLNLATTSTIESFHQNRLVVKSDTGQTSTFLRAM